ncbi:MAG: DUF2249 domain-containing protein [Pyrinomonadaceae bacterium]
MNCRVGYFYLIPLDHQLVYFFIRSKAFFRRQNLLEILGLKDSDPRIIFVDIILQAEKHQDPMPKIVKTLVSLKLDDVLLVHHPFDPILLRNMFARRGYASWAEERRPEHWFIYFYIPSAAVGAIAHPPVDNLVYAKAAGAGFF